jgi:hypothetical protein
LLVVLTEKGCGTPEMLAATAEFLAIGREVDATSAQKALTLLAGLTTVSGGPPISLGAALSRAIDVLGYSRQIPTILDTLALDDSYSEVFERLVKPSLKHPELLERIPAYFGQLTNPPTTFYIRSAYKHAAALKILGGLLPQPLGPILTAMFSKRLVGLVEEFDYEACVDSVRQA